MCPPPQPIVLQHFSCRHFWIFVATAPLHIRHLPPAPQSRAVLRIRDFPDPALYNVRMPRTIHAARATNATQQGECLVA